MLTDFSEGDQSTMSGPRVVAAISGGKISCWPISTSIFQPRALASCPVSGLGGGWLGLFCPSRMNVGAVMGFVVPLNLLMHIFLLDNVSFLLGGEMLTGKEQILVCV